MTAFWNDAGRSLMRESRWVARQISGGRAGDEKPQIALELK